MNDRREGEMGLSPVSVSKIKYCIIVSFQIDGYVDD